jgi:hypothetical protein
MKREPVCPRRPHSPRAHKPASPTVSSDAIENKSLTLRLHRRQAFIEILKDILILI